MTSSAANPALIRKLTLFTVSMTVFLSAMTMSGVNIATPQIAIDLNADALMLSWIPAAHLWGTIVAMLPAGRLTDIIGRKPVFLAGLSVFCLSALLTLLVRDIETLLVIRVMQGISGACIYATGMAMVSVAYRGANRGFALGITSSAIYLGLTCGPIIGGYLTEHLGWHSVFTLPASPMVFAILATLIFIKEPPANESAAKMDWSGSALFGLAASTLIYGLSALNSLLGATAALAGVALIYLFLKQQRRKRAPLVDLRIFKQNRIFSYSVLAALMMYGALFPTAFLISNYMQLTLGFSPSEAGSYLLIQTAMMVLVAPAAGRISDGYEPRIIATLGCLCFAAGFLVLTFLGAEANISLIVLALTLLGIGFGLFSSPNNNAAIEATEESKVGIASAILNLARTSGNAVAMSLVMLLFNTFIGSREITQTDLTGLIDVNRTTFTICLLSALAASYFSLNRGTLR